MVIYFFLTIKKCDYARECQQVLTNPTQKEKRFQFKMNEVKFVKKLIL